jgi:hypothetical protein
MDRIAALLVIALTATPVAAEPPSALPAGRPGPADLEAPAAARMLFERDWVLMNWALKYYDANHDILIEPDEAAAAAQAFRRLADTNHDGRVTPEEYQAAREELLARY